MQNRETAQLIMDGWLIDYDLFRPREILRGRTPAEVAGIRFTFDN